jgi:hypothetical protein
MKASSSEGATAVTCIGVGQVKSCRLACKRSPSRPLTCSVAPKRGHQVGTPGSCAQALGEAVEPGPLISQVCSRWPATISAAVPAASRVP